MRGGLAIFLCHFEELECPLQQQRSVFLQHTGLALPQPGMVYSLMFQISPKGPM